MEDDEDDGAPKEITAPGWMATYGDLMSLLLVFFILLVSFSSMEVVKFRQAMGSLKGGEGFFDPNSSMSPVQFNSSDGTSDMEFNQAVEEMVEELEEQQIENQVQVFWDKSGVRFVMQDQVLFEPGTSDLRPQFIPVIDAVLKVLTTYPVEELRIEGHTDDAPIHTARFPTNWELSVDRATRVLRYVERTGGYEPRRLVAVGFGEFRPAVPNNSVANRAKNRRVEIYAARKPGA
ncbi:MAG: flagellar motor protein MotB [Calditrichaeota bacterium]|nr:flagellar motor protein MotB [Candidatus Cloacimonadota bacterium]MCB1045908.1 flagellar motor protein MotB [Calditrichota bacterium]MCB9474722.1 flagellar motor protein MotB [Candidatus Delongbacteria bacterium]